MQCSCCDREVLRGTDFPEARGWIRPGDRYCPPCCWLLPREMAFDDFEATKEWCPEHGTRGATKVHPVTPYLD